MSPFGRSHFPSLVVARVCAGVMAVALVAEPDSTTVLIAAHLALWSPLWWFPIMIVLGLTLPFLGVQPPRRRERILSAVLLITWMMSLVLPGFLREFPVVAMAASGSALASFVAFRGGTRAAESSRTDVTDDATQLAWTLARRYFFWVPLLFLISALVLHLLAC